MSNAASTSPTLVAPSKAAERTKGDWHDLLQTAANFASLLVAVMALYFSITTYQNTVHTDNQSKARQSWSDFLAMAAENPDISNLGSEWPKGWKESIRYTRYRERMYFYMDSVLTLDSDPKWRPVISSELWNHRPYICAGHAIAEAFSKAACPSGNCNEGKAGSGDAEIIYSQEFRQIESDFIAQACPSAKDFN